MSGGKNIKEPKALDLSLLKSLNLYLGDNVNQ